MFNYLVSFTSGFIAGKLITSKNAESLKKAAIKTYIIIKDEFKLEKKKEAE